MELMIEQMQKDIYRLRWQAVYLSTGHRSLKSFAAWIGVTEQHLHFVIFRERPSKKLWEKVVSKLGYDPRIENGKALEEVFGAMVSNKPIGHPETSAPLPQEKEAPPKPGSPPSYYQPGSGK